MHSRWVSLRTRISPSALPPETRFRHLAVGALRRGIRIVPIAQQQHPDRPAPPERSGSASGMLATARRLAGQTTGAALMALLFHVVPGKTAPHGPKVISDRRRRAARRAVASMPLAEPLRSRGRGDQDAVVGRLNSPNPAPQSISRQRCRKSVGCSGRKGQQEQSRGHHRKPRVAQQPGVNGASTSSPGCRDGRSWAPAAGLLVERIHAGPLGGTGLTMMAGGTVLAFCHIRPISTSSGGWCSAARDLDCSNRPTTAPDRPGPARTGAVRRAAALATARSRGLATRIRPPAQGRVGAVFGHDVEQGLPARRLSFVPRGVRWLAHASFAELACSRGRYQDAVVGAIGNSPNPAPAEHQPPDIEIRSDVQQEGQQEQSRGHHRGSPKAAQQPGVNALDEQPGRCRGHADHHGGPGRQQQSRLDAAVAAGLLQVKGSATMASICLRNEQTDVATETEKTPGMRSKRTAGLDTARVQLAADG